jgi:hypothetical protein
MPKGTMIQPAPAAGYLNVDAPPTAHAEFQSVEPDVIKFSNTEQLLASILQLLMSGHELEIKAQIPDGGRAVKHELRVFPRPVERPLQDATSDE